MAKAASKVNRGVSRPALIQGLCFALCFFAFQLTEFTVNDRAGVLLGAGSVNAVYSVGIACTALGFLSFSLLRALFQSERSRKRVICVVGVLAVVAAVLVLTAEASALFLASSFGALLLFGNIGGCIYYNAAMSFAGERCAGRILGVGMGCAVLLQFAVQNLLITREFFIASVGLSVAVLIYFVLQPPRDWMFENPLPYSSENKTDRDTALTLLLAVAVMSLVIGLIDGVVVAKHAEGQLSVSSTQGCSMRRASAWRALSRISATAVICRSLRSARCSSPPYPPPCWRIPPPISGLRLLCTYTAAFTSCI